MHQQLQLQHPLLFKQYLSHRRFQILVPSKILFLITLTLLLCFNIFSLSANAAVTSIKNVQKALPGEFILHEDQYYYQYEDGTFASDCLLKINKKNYLFSESGERLYGWQKIGPYQYYFGKKTEGFMYKNRWRITNSGNYYRFNKSGRSIRGWYTLKKKTYYFDEATGKRLYGWQTIDGQKYYLGKKKHGYMYTSTWVTYKKKHYYLNENGTTLKGWQTIDGERYYFAKAGYAYTGTKKIKGKRYYFNDKGVLLYGGASKNLKLESDCAILINADTGATLYEKRADMKHQNASTTKIMTCIIALEKCKLNEVVTASANAAGTEASKLYMHTGEKFYLNDLLYSLMLPSHNDTAVAIAEHISGSTTKFVKRMNNKAKKIGCTSTNFVTPNGLDKDIYTEQNFNHYSTARDMAKIAQYAYQNETFRKIISTKTYSFRSINGYSYWFTSTNSLLGTMDGVTGMKTGYTGNAGYCFAGSMENANGETYICIILGGPTSTARWDDAEKLFEYANSLK